MAWLVGLQREEINWYPTIDSSKCLKCGTCMNCGKKVYDWSSDKGAIVARPFDCVVGCNTCANLCQGVAITFPDVQYIRDIYQKEHLWGKIRKQMLEEGKIN
jgi:MinD superfamily P-loop ATPase